MAADEMFGNWKKEQEVLSQQQQQQQQHAPAEGRDAPADDMLDVGLGPGAGAGTGAGAGAGAGSAGGADDSAAAETLQTKPAKQPTEVVLRGYRSADYQYAALQRYEQIAGRICEDYPRDPPIGSRRYRSSLRDSAARSAATLASHGRAALTAAERQAVMRAAGGQHWVKVTFESAQAADAALYASPQSVLGCLVTAEPYRGVPLPAGDDVAVPDPNALDEHEQGRHHRAQHAGGDQGFGRYAASSQTADSGTVTHEDPFATRPSTAGSSAAPAPPPGGLSRRQAWAGREETQAQTQTQATAQAQPPADAYCRRIPTARRATLKAPELALLPSESTMRRVAKRLPLLHRLTGTIIGNQVPRLESGLFDWDKASLYWKLIWWLDSLFGLFGGEILDANKE